MRALTVLLLLTWASTAGAREHWMNPGTMGANALPSVPVQAPWIDDFTLLQVGVAAQEGWLRDASLLPTFRLISPFGKFAEAYLEGSPFELWWSSDQTRQAWALTRTEGIAKADIRFGFKVLLADAGQGLPKLAFRALTKATTGKDVESRRFNDGPAYHLEVLLGQRIAAARGVQVDVLTSAAYWIWQQGSAGQNDAMHYGMAVNVQLAERWSGGLEARGYIGWQQNDKPLVLGARVGFLPVSWLEVMATANVGLVDAPRLEGRLDLRFRLPSLVPLLFHLDPPAPP
jgi:hypothetical protein